MAKSSGKCVAIVLFNNSDAFTRVETWGACLHRPRNGEHLAIWFAACLRIKTGSVGRRT